MRDTFLKFTCAVTLASLLVACATDKGATPVTFNFGGQDSPSELVSAAIGSGNDGDILGIFLVANGPDMPPIIQPVAAGQTSVTLEVPNGPDRVFQVRAYVKGLTGDDQGGASGPPPGSEPYHHFPAAFLPARVFDAQSPPQTLSGAPINLNLSLQQVTNQAGLLAPVRLVDSTDPNIKVAFPGKVFLRDVSTGFTYPSLLPTPGEDMGLPPILLYDNPYEVVIEISNDPNQNVIVPFDIPAGSGPGVMLAEIQVPVNPRLFSDEAQLAQAITQSNGNSRVDLIRYLPPSGGTQNQILLQNSLPAINDPFGTVLVADNSLTIDGSGLTSTTPGLRVISSNTVLGGFKLANFVGVGLAIQGTATSIINNIRAFELGVFNSLGGGVRVRDAQLAILGPKLDLIGNIPFGIKFTGATEFCILAGSYIRGDISATGLTSGVVIEGLALNIGIGDPGDPGSTGSNGNVIIGNSFGVEIKGNGDQVSVEGNAIGFDPFNQVVEPNSLGVFADLNGGEIRMFGNEFVCNSEFSTYAECPTGPTTPLPTLLTDGGNVVVSDRVKRVDFSRNLVTLATRGFYLMNNSTADNVFIDHNTFYRNEVGIRVGQNNQQLDILNNIVSYSAENDSATTLPPRGLLFESNASTLFAANNLLFNFDETATPFDLDCLHEDGGTFCNATFGDGFTSVNQNIKCSDASSIEPCRPAFVSVTPGTLDFNTFDLSLKPSSPAVDAAGPTPPGEFVLGSALDIGAIESH